MIVVVIIIIIVLINSITRWSSGQHVPRHVHKFQMWIRSGTVSTQPREVADLIKNVYIIKHDGA